MPDAIPSFANFDTGTNAEKFDAAIAAAPPSVIQRIAKLQRHEDVHFGALAAKRERAGDLRKKLDDLAATRARIERDEESMGPLKRTRTLPDGKTETIVVDRLGSIDTTIKRLKLEDRKNSSAPLPNAPHIPRNWIARVPDWLPVEVPLVIEPTAEERERAVAATDAAFVEIQRVQDAPRPLDYVLERIDTELDRLAKAGEPRIGSLFKGGRYNERTGRFEIDVPYAGVNWPEKLVRHEFGTNRGTVDAMLELFVWACGDTLREKLHELAATRARDERALSIGEKQDALAEAQAAAVEALRVEVETFFAIEDATGAVLNWRPRIHPAILLGCHVDPAAALAWED